MKKFFLPLFSVLLLAWTISAQTVKPTMTPTPAPAANDEDVVKISTNLIQVDVTVTDKSGKIITDLKPEDFEIFENGQKQDITNFSFVNVAPEIAPAPIPTPQKKADKTAVPLPPPTTLKPEQIRRTVALVVDDLTLSFESVYYVRRALKKFVDEQMQDGDLVAIIRTGGGIGALQQFTSDKRQLYAAIDKIRWNPAGNGKIGAFAPVEASPLERAKAGGADVSDEDIKAEKNQQQRFNDFQGSVFATGTLGALNYIIKGMKELPGRKTIMLMSDGLKLFTVDEQGNKEFSIIMESLQRLTDLANRSSVVIYTLDARGLQTLGLTAEDNTNSLSSDDIQQRMSDRRDELFDTQDGLAYLAAQTGGFPILNNNDLGGGIKKVLNDQKGYYLVGYTPDSDTFDAKTRRFNKLTVKVKRPDTKVRYRSGFFGVADKEETDVAQGTPKQQIMNALTSPFAVNGISLHLNTLFANDQKAGDYIRSLLHVNANDLKFTDEADGTHKATFDVLAVSFGDNGLVVDQIARNYTLTVKKDNYDKFLHDGFVYNFLFPVKKPGAYQLRVALRDSGSQKVGSANQFIEVPNLKKGQLTLSGIVLENMTIEQFQSFQKNASVPPPSNEEAKMDSQADTSLRQFKSGTILRYGFEVYNAKSDGTQKPQLMRQTRVFRDGKLLFEGKAAPLEIAELKNSPKVASVGALNLGTDMQPGDYVLQIIVTDNLAKEKAKVTSQFVQFEIVQ